MKILRILAAPAAFIAYLYGLFFLLMEVLPDGWAEQPSTHWWALPTCIVALILSVGALIVTVAVTCIQMESL